MNARLWGRVLGAWLVLAASPPAWASSEVDALLNKLVEKGLLTASDAQAVRSEIAPQPAASEEERLTKLENTLDDKTVLHVGKGTAKIGGLFQGWVVHDGLANDRVRIRRTELKLAGDILGDDRFKYTVMFDPAQVQEDNTTRSTLKDAYFLLDHLPYLPRHAVTLGQFKPPRTEEGTRAVSQLDFAERAIVTSTFGDQRDMGIMLTGDWPFVLYQAGVFNGKQNQTPKQDQKDLVGRLVVRPLKLLASMTELPDVGSLELGISGEHRPHGGTAVPKKRLGYEARYAYQNFSVKGEYMAGEETTSALSTSQNASIGKGWYTQAGYLLAPWFPKAEVLARFEGWDPDANTSLDAERDLTLGFNYFVDKHNAKWQLNWVHQAKQDGKIDNQVIGALQYAF